jgi:serine/threonine-protein kinase RsbW/stage II sporulation protein AB (anti-sigma F factor)
MERWHGRFPATAEAVHVIRGEMAAVAKACGLSETCISDVKLAVSEAATNAVLHAYPDGIPGAVAATAWTEAAQLRITISDEGTGMVPRTDSPGLGFGLPLIASLADDLQVITSSQGGTEIRLAFPCPHG